ncbi:hypothetical protein NL676_032475 [Syzygium grande]|nr:hypothetical protein NL676_032475 [Syzygium grande]
MRDPAPEPEPGKTGGRKNTISSVVPASPKPSAGASDFRAKPDPKQGSEVSSSKEQRNLEERAGEEAQVSSTQLGYRSTLVFGQMPEKLRLLTQNSSCIGD